MPAPLLTVDGLTTSYYRSDILTPAVEAVSFELEANTTVGIVGESGCGKSTIAYSIMRLIDPAAGRIVAGDIKLEGESLLSKSEPEMRQIRGQRVAMIFQNPSTHLNPVYSVENQIVESLRLHQSLKGEKARARALRIMELVGIPDPARRLRSFPHHLSGGMQQRVLTAIALACEPRLLIADEPTTALDVTIQAQILDLIRELKGRLGMGVILITHDMGVIAEMADHVLVMYAGKVVERAPVNELFAAPRHPYTKALLACIPSIEGDVDSLPAIGGAVPVIGSHQPGCRFAPRCPAAMPVCREKDPPFFETGGRGHRSACWLEEGGRA